MNNRQFTEPLYLRKKYRRKRQITYVIEERFLLDCSQKSNKILYEACPVFLSVSKYRDRTSAVVVVVTVVVLHLHVMQ